MPPRRSLTNDAIKRLDAIESLEELGIGFTLATHDLEIRGAGEILGEGQSGQISEVGYTMYTQLLERAVDALKADARQNWIARLIMAPKSICICLLSSPKTTCPTSMRG